METSLLLTQTNLRQSPVSFNDYDIGSVPIRERPFHRASRQTLRCFGCIVERADEIEHNGYIVELIMDRLRSCNLLVADTTTRNPNVFYEIGYSHALNIPTILLCREGEEMPFDVRAINHIIYGSIVDLRDKLERRLRSTLAGSSA